MKETVTGFGRTTNGAVHNLERFFCSLLPIPLDWFGATPEKVILMNKMC